MSNCDNYSLCGDASLTLSLGRCYAHQTLDHYLPGSGDCPAEYVLSPSGDG